MTNNETPSETSRRWLEGDVQDDEMPVETVSGTITLNVSAEAPVDATDEELRQLLIAVAANKPWDDISAVDIDD